MGKKTFFIVILAVAALIAYKFLHGGGGRPPMPTQPVVTLSAGKETVHDSVEALGTANANESIDITATVTETISEIRFQDGQHVKKGDIIVLLDQQEETAQLGAARAQLAENERELGRLKNLRANRAASQRDYDERATMRDVTLQQIKEIEARIEDRTLRAPFAGQLGVRRLSVGALVRPGDLITTLDDENAIKLDFTVPALYIDSLAPGLKVEATSDAIRDKVFEGVIDTVNSRIDPVTHSVLVRALLPNEEGLIRPGLLMQVTLLKDRREVLVVPEESVMQRQSKHYLMIVKDDNTVQEREVQIGIRKNGVVEITRGLQVGEKLIVRGMGSVRDGQQIVVQESWDKMKDSQFESTPEK